MHYLVKPTKGNADLIDREIKKLVDLRMCHVELVPEPQYTTPFRSDKPSSTNQKGNGHPTVAQRLQDTILKIRPENVTGSDLRKMCVAMGFKPHAMRDPLKKFVREGFLTMVKQIDNRGVCEYKVNYDG